MCRSFQLSFYRKNPKCPNAARALPQPFEGLSPAIIPTVTEGLAQITRLGRAILLADSNIHHVPEFTDRLSVIERGEISFSGSPREVERDQAVMRIIGGG
jgi:branched-chain amino acid transport system ATP-binding protein